ncbi:sugar ABC transporter substrate-binding protein [Candidatus Calescamantes bacterium]|nr:sugar ABC transporter substrate-binding protein [Candidatus Calescamantes bacterium]
MPLNKSAFITIVFLIAVSMLIGSCARKKDVSREPIILRYLAGAHPVYDAIRRKQSEDFKKVHPQVKVIYQTAPAKYLHQKLLAMIAGGAAPDVFTVESEYLPQFVEKNALMCLDPYIEKDRDFNIDDFFPELIECFRYKGKLYGIPGSFSVTVLYYNKKMFDEVGLSYPDENWTWETFLDAAKRLTKQDASGRVIQFGAADWINWHTAIKQNGGKLWNEDKSRCIINSPESLEAIKFSKDLQMKYHVIPTGSEAKEMGWYQIFLGQRAAMFFGLRWYTVVFRKNKDLKWGIAPLPMGKLRATDLATHCWAISSQCKHPDLAWEFLKSITGPQGAKYIASVGDSVPVIKEIAMSDTFLHNPEYPNENNEVYLKSLEYAYSRASLVHPKIPYEEMKHLIEMELEKFYLDKQTAEETLKNIEDKLNRRIRD